MSENLGLTVTSDWSNYCVEEEPTALLRYVMRDGDRVLQQGWRITTRGSILSIETEWRDVPVEVDP